MYFVTMARMNNSDLPAVLVLDGNQRSALAVVRSLGGRGIRVVVAETSARSLSGMSRHCWKQAVYTSPSASTKMFVSDLLEISRKYGVSVLLPISDITTSVVLHNRDSLKELLLPFPSLEAYINLTNKNNLLTVAAARQITTPVTLCVNSSAELLALSDKIKYPAVLKPVSSKILHLGKWIGTSVTYVSGPKELAEAVHRIPWIDSVQMLVQQRVDGAGQGVFALCDHGHVLAWFAHQRLREKPPSGGVSVLSESIDLSPQLKRWTEALLGADNWHGVAMVEYKLDTNSNPYLIEVNGRFWGSLQLAVDSGVDFPYLLYQLATGQKIITRPGYQIGVQLRWLLGDLDRLYLVIKDSKVCLSAKVRAIASFLNFFQSNLHYEVNRLSDMRPFFYETRNYFRALFKQKM